MSADPVLGLASAATPVTIAVTEPTVLTARFLDHSNQIALTAQREPERTGSAAAEQTPARHEVVFVDTRVHGYQQFLEDFLSQTSGEQRIEARLLDAERDGIEQISQALAGYSDLDAVHFLSHGTDGAVQLGATWLDRNSLQASAGAIAQWSASLSADADLLFYGCDLAASPVGIAFVEQLSLLTGADVAASVDRTGSTLLGGDWDLEFAIGTVDTAIAVAPGSQQSWSGILAAPTASNMNAAETYTLDTPLDLADIVINDVDSANVTASLILSDSAAGSLSTATSGSVTSTYNAVTGVWNASGAIADVNALLANLTYTPSLLYLFPFTIATSVDDGVATITGSKSMTMGLLNFAPNATNLNAGQTFTEDTPLNLTNIVISDIDSPNATATLTLSNTAAGSLSSGSSGEVTSTYNAATGVWSASGAIADVNTLLAGLTFTPALNYNSNFTIATRVDDGVAPAITGTKAMTGIAVNDAPTASNLSAAESFTEDTPLNLTNIVVSDVDSATVTATLTLSVPAAGSLNTATSGAVTSTYNAGMGVWTASGAIANVNTLLAGLTFTPALNYNSNFTIATSVNDGVAAPITGTKAMTGIAVNDAPTASNLNAAESFTEDTALNLTNIVVSDVDSATVTATLTLSAPAAGSLNTATSGAVTSTYNAGTGVWSASGAIANVNTLLAALTFTPSLNYNINFTIATSVDDGVAPAITGTKAMTGSAVNDAPTASNLNAAESFTEDTPLNLTNIVVSDVDSATVTATLTLSAPAAGSLNTATSGAVTSTYNAATGIWSASGAIANVNTLLAGLTFTPALNYNSNFSIATSVNDGVAPAITGTKSMTGIAVNDAPVNSVPGFQSTAQDTSLTFDPSNSNLISINDVDASSSQVQVTLTATDGTVTLNWGSLTATTVGSEFRVNTTTSDRQTLLDGQFYGGTTNDFNTRSVASDATGNFVVTWSSKNQDGDGWGVYAQRYNSAGVAQGGEFRVNTNTADDQVHASIAMDDAGNFVIVWAWEVGGNDWGIYAQRYNAAGAAQGTEIHVNTYTTREQLGPSVAMNGSGSFVVAWSSKDQDGDNWGVFAKRYNASGVVQGGEFRVNTTTAKEQTNASVAIDDAGNFTITWSSKDQDGDNWGVYGKRYNPGGLAQGAEFRVNTATAKEQMFSSVAMDAAGDFVVTWSSKDQDGDNWGVYAQRYNPLGVAQGGAFQVNLTTAKEQVFSFVAMDTDGDFVISWSSKDQDGNGWGVYARQFDAAGVAKTGETLVNTTTAGDQEHPSVAMDAQGDFVVVWHGNGPGDTLGVFAQRFTAASPFTFSTGDGTRDATMTFQGTLAEINAALDGLVFTPTVGFNGLATVTITTNDLGNSGSGGARSDSDTININVGSANVAPTLTLTGGTLNYTENDPATVIDSAAIVIDPDSADFDGGQLNVFFSAGGTDDDRLAIRNQGTATGEIGVSGSNVTYNYGAGAVVIASFAGGSDGVTPLVVTLSANATTVAVQALVRNVTYQNRSDNPSILDRIVQFTLTDGDSGVSGAASRNINLAAVNDAPTASNLSAPESFTEDTPLNLTDIVVGDLDSPDVTVTLTLSDAAAGNLNTATSGTVTSTYNAVTGVWSASGAIAEVNTLLAGLTFTPGPNYNSNFTIATSVDDGVGPATTGTKNMTGIAVNDAPVLVNNTLSISEGGIVVLSGSEMSATDVDNASGSLTFTASGVAGGQFELISNPSIAITSFTQAQVTGGAVRFVHDGEEAAPGYDVRVSDGSLSDGPAAAAITFTNVNDAPTASNLNAAETYTEDTPLNLTDIVVSEVDSATVTMTLTLSDPAAGNLNTGTSGTVTSTYNPATGVWSASGAIADVNTLLAGLTFTPGLNYNSDFTIATSVDDGIALAITGTKNMTGTAVNDAPTASNLSAPETFTEDTPLNLTDIVVSDVDSATVTVTLTLSDSAAGSLNTATSGAVTSTYNAGTGIWSASGAITDVNALLAALTFTPSLNYNSDFTIATSVDDGIAPPLTGIKNMTGTAINDGPTASNLNAAETYTEETPLNLTDIVVSDVDSANVTATLTLSDSAAGSLNTATSGAVTSTYNAGTGVWSASGAITDVNALLAALTFTPSLNYNSDFTIATSVDDGIAPPTTGIKNMTANAVNDAPVLVNNALTITEGGSVILSSSEMSASDTDNATGSLTFAVSGVAGGQFELLSNPGVAISSFTQAQVTLGAVLFVHDGGELAPRYDVRVSDGSLSDGPAAAAITFTNVNDAPVLVNNRLIITEGTSVVLTSANLSAIDADNDENNLQFSISAVSGGRFELITNPGFAVTSFTQVQVLGGIVRFVHNGGSTPPHYAVSVSDGLLSAGPTPATVTFIRLDTGEPLLAPLPLPPATSAPPPPTEPPTITEPLAIIPTTTDGSDSTGVGGGDDPPSSEPEPVQNEFQPAVNTSDPLDGSASTPAKMFYKSSSDIREGISTRSEAPVITPNSELEEAAIGRLSSGDLSSVIDVSGFVQGLNKLRDKVQEEAHLEKIVIGSTMTATTGFSIGYVFWLLRGEVLLTSLLASLPAWRLIDPLPVLSSLNKSTNEDEDQDDDSIEAAVKQSGETPPSRLAPKQQGGPRSVKWRFVMEPPEPLLEKSL